MEKKLTEAQEITMKLIAQHLRIIHGTDGEVSLPFYCAMETPDGTIQMTAYKLHDSQKDPFWVAVESLPKN